LIKLPKTYNGEKTASLTNVAEKLDVCLQKTETRSMLVLCTSINSKWIMGLNIRPETVKLVQKRTGNMLEAIGIGKDFLGRTQAVAL
jgi:hypothetical protein